MNRFSIIMPSFLGEYPHAATNREMKLRRAVDSVLSQTFTDWELIVVADGCERTEMIMSEYTDKRIICSRIEKQKLFSSIPRQYGKMMAQNEFILYLDSDDYFDERHLQRINQAILLNPDYDWYQMDDYQFDGTERYAQKSRYTFGECKTSNIVHRHNVGVWNVEGYAHDWEFVKTLGMNYKHIGQGGYIVCHVPQTLDV